MILESSDRGVRLGWMELGTVVIWSCLGFLACQTRFDVEFRPHFVFPKMICKVLLARLDSTCNNHARVPSAPGMTKIPSFATRRQRSNILWRRRANDDVISQSTTPFGWFASRDEYTWYQYGIVEVFVYAQGFVFVEDYFRERDDDDRNLFLCERRQRTHLEHYNPDLVSPEKWVDRGFTSART